MISLEHKLSHRGPLAPHGKCLVPAQAAGFTVRSPQWVQRLGTTEFPSTGELAKPQLAGGCKVHGCDGLLRRALTPSPTTGKQLVPLFFVLFLSKSTQRRGSGTNPKNFPNKFCLGFAHGLILWNDPLPLSRPFSPASSHPSSSQCNPSAADVY